VTTDRVTQVAAEAVVSTPSSQALRVTQLAVEVIVRTRRGWTIGRIPIG
jgi:hypothetical protein